LCQNFSPFFSAKQYFFKPKHPFQVIHGKENGAKGGAGKSVGDRTLKNMFKKLIGQLIGKDVAQMFKQVPILPVYVLHKTPNNGK
jgi:hypothetical protein